MKKDFTPWLLLPGIMLALSSVTLLAPRQAAEAAPPAPAQSALNAAADKTAAYDDGDGDELLEHWGDAKYAEEARRQMAGIGGGLLVLAAAAAYRRRSRLPRSAAVPLPREADFLKLDSVARRPDLNLRSQLGSAAPQELDLETTRRSETPHRKAA